MGTVTTPGYYDGEFKQAGQNHSGSDATDTPDLDKLSKDELAALAKDRGLEVKATDSKAELISKLSA